MTALTTSDFTTPDVTSSDTASISVDTVGPSPLVASDPARIAPEELNVLHQLIEQGQYLRAYARLHLHLPLTRLRDAASCYVAGRLAANLGDSELANWLHLRAFRADRANIHARYGYARVALERKGPLAAWNLMNRLGDPSPDAPGMSADTLAEWYSLRGLAAGMLRDFDTAEAWLDRAESVAPLNPWVWVERSSVLEEADRYEEALTAAQKSLELRPWYRAGVQAAAHILTLLGRDDEALEMLTAASERLESAVVTYQLLSLLMERQEYAEAERALARFETLAPLAGDTLRQWSAGARSDLAYHAGDREQAITLARETENPFFLRVAANMLAAAPDAGRIQLPVGFVRQHHMTCAPATLATLGRYWQEPVNHLEIAADICYNGTPWHNERDWAEARGWVARDFRVTWESACRLLERGIPFTLTTAGAGYAHMQAVIGCDTRRGTFLIRDPYVRSVREALAQELLASLRSIGPAGMVFVPPDRAHLLEGIALADADLYDRHYALSRALVRHDRDAAYAAFESMQAQDDEHRLTIEARLAIAVYDQDSVEALACTQRLAERYPLDANLKLSLVSCLHRLSRRDERLNLLQTLCADAAGATAQAKQAELAERESSGGSATSGGEDADIRFSLAHAAPLFWQQYAQELADDAREHDRALLLCRRAIRRQPTQARNLYTCATILWDRQAFGEAFALYRFAACLENTGEHLSRAYFAAARYLRQTEGALQFLRGRFARLGAQSALPARTLYEALAELDRRPEAFGILEQALALRPDDGDLLLFAAIQRARHGQRAWAAALLDAARDKTSRVEWLRTQAQLAEIDGNMAHALACWRDILALAPLALDAHEAAANLLLAASGQSAVQAHFAAFSARFPHHCALHQRWAKWMRGHDEEHDDPAHERVLRHLIDIDPADAWARRELAHLLGETGRVDEALEQAQHALALEPNNTRSHATLGEMRGKQGEWDRARDHFRRAIVLSVDNDYAVSRLVAACDTPAQKRETLAFVQAQLRHQTVYGEGLLAFRRHAQGILAPADIYAALYATLRDRPDLWHAWSAAIQQLIALDRAPEAEHLAVQATAHFPLTAPLWLDLARARDVQGNASGEQEALRRTLEMSPDFAPAARQLAGSLREQGCTGEARQTLEKALARDPHNPELQSSLAYILWQMGEREEALAQTRALTRREPGYTWAWESLHDWSQQMGRGEEAREALRDLTRRRPGEVRSWLMLARSLDGPDLLGERLAALDKAIALNPRFYEAYSLKARLLTGQGRYEEALTACKPPPGQPTPTHLRATSAWISAERGNERDAITQMRTLLAEDPNYLWGWTQLALWSRRLNINDTYHEAARRMVALDPQDALSHTYLADALRRGGDKNGAKQAFGRAILVSQDAAYAGAALFDLQMEDGEIAQAQQTIDTLLARGREGWVYALAVRLALHVKDERLAAQRLYALCLLGGDVGGSVEEAVEHMQKAGCENTLSTLWEQLIEQAGARPAVGWYWAKDRVRRQDMQAETRLNALLGRGEIGARALSGWIEGLADAKNLEAVNKFAHLHRERLRAHDAAWGSVMYAFLTLRQYEKAADWSHDWQARSGAGAWMLLNRALALRTLSRDAEAATVSRHALTLSEDHSTPKHALWLGLDSALEGDSGSAQQHLRRADPASLPAYYQYLHHLASAITQVQSASPSGRAEAFRQARGLVRQAIQVYPTFASGKLTGRIFPHCVRRIATASRSPLAPAWMAAQCLLVLPLRRRGLR